MHVTKRGNKKKINKIKIKIKMKEERNKWNAITQTMYIWQAHVLANVLDSKTVYEYLGESQHLHKQRYVKTAIKPNED